MKNLLESVTYIGVFAVPLVVLLVTGSMFFPYITGKNFTFRILVEIMTVSWVLLALYDARYRPRFSWISAALLSFLVVMLFVNLLGEYPLKSFWSNYERMDGYVTLVHFALYFLVAGTMLSAEKHWNWLFNTTLAVATLVCFYAFAQISGAVEISQGGTWRVDSTLGNSTYMAVYMLFHIFIAALMYTRTSVHNRKIAYGLLIVLFTVILFQTGTRGAALGLVGGGILTALYLAIFAVGYPKLRKVGVGILAALILLVAGFVAVRHTSFVQNTPILDRLADITLQEGNVRFMVWNMAWQGIKERPILGWGQENFNYVFNTYYNPNLFDAEPWYDRTHNVVFDWLIAGGVLGALAYFSIFAAALYYLLVRPLLALVRRERDSSPLPVVERALIFGLLGAYVFHNLFVFDNVVSYIFFALILAYIHSKTSAEIPWMTRVKIDQAIIGKIMLPVAGVLLAVVIYFVNVPAMLAAGDIIGAFRAPDIEARFAAFERALDRGSFGRQEIVEQLSEQAMTVAGQEGISESTARTYTELAEKELLSMIEEKPGDPRFYLFLAGIYRAQGDIELAADTMAHTRALSPSKPTFIIEQGVLEFQQNDFNAMAGYFKEAYELAPEFERALLLYAGSLLYTGPIDRLPEILTEPRLLAFADNVAPFLPIATNDRLAVLDQHFEAILDAGPENVTARIAYAQLLQLRNQPERAIALIEEGVEVNPMLGSVAACFIENIQSDRLMREPCE